MKTKILFDLFLFAFVTSSIFAQTTQQGSRIYQNKRVALVVGNSDYLIGPLKNPVNDARAMKNALEKTGFEVLYYENILNKDNFTRAVRTFGQRLQNGEVGLFYFAGHGLQVKGINYLVPVKAEVLSEPEVEYECLDVGFVLAQMEAANNRMNIVILDACRNNPFARSFRSADRGLATMMAPTGTLIAYATAPGSVAADGAGENGLYTEHILKQITKPGLKIEEVFKYVRAEVVQISNNRQVPWESSSLIGDFYFIVPSDLETFTNTITQNNTDLELTNNTNTRDNTKNESSRSLWRGNNNGYWLTVDGKEIAIETENQWYENDLLVIHKPTNRAFLLKDYNNNLDSIGREAIEVSIPSYYSNPYVYWHGNNTGYWIYLNGVNINQETSSEWQNENLRVYHQKSGMTFIIRNYNACLDNLVRPAEIVLNSGDANKIINVQWRATQAGYWFALNGREENMNTTSSWEGNDLIVVHKSSGKRFRLVNFNMYLDNKWRPVIPEN